VQPEKNLMPKEGLLRLSAGKRKETEKEKIRKTAGGV
jgi:hypothetical protein